MPKVSSLSIFDDILSIDVVAVIYLDWGGVDLEQIHSSPNYFRLSFFLVWLNTCLRRYSLALDPIRGDFGSSPSRSLYRSG